MKWRLLPRALRDLRDIEAHVSADSPEAAAAIASRLTKAFDLISSRPDIGRPASRASVREWSVPGLPYVIPYRVSGNTIEILRVWHTKRNRPQEW